VASKIGIDQALLDFADAVGELVFWDVLVFCPVLKGAGRKGSHMCPVWRVGVEKWGMRYPKSKRKERLLGGERDAEVRGLRAWPRPCTCGRRAVPLTLFVRLLRVVAGLSPPHPPFVSGRRFGDTPLPAPPQGGREKCGNKASFVASLSRVEMLTHPLRGPCDSRSSESGVFSVRQGKNVPPTAQEKEARKAPCVGRKQPQGDER
jgi:hypothetical protein